MMAGPVAGGAPTYAFGPPRALTVTAVAVVSPSLTRPRGRVSLRRPCRVQGTRHNGEIYGYNSTMFHLPSRKATIIVLTNLMGEKSFADEMLGGFPEVLFPEILPKATG